MVVLTRKRSVSCAEADIVEPSNSDERSTRRSVLRRARREDSEHDRRDREEQTVGKVSTDHRPPAAHLVNAHNTDHLRDQRQDRRYALVLERVVGVDAHISVDSR